MISLESKLDKAWESKSAQELVNAPISALQGLSDKDGELLAEALGIKTIADLADNKFFHWAQAIKTLAS